MSFKLRDYQESGIAESRKAFMQGYQSVLFASPCGSGKGSVIAYIMDSAAKMGNRVLMLAHRTDLVAGPNAIADRMEKQLKVPKKYIGYLIPKANFKKYNIHSSQGHNRQLVMGTVQTASRRKLGHFDILIVDEAHRIRTGMYEQVLKNLLAVNPGLVVMGFTATPERFDGKGLGDVFQKLVQISSHGEMVKRKFLVPSTYKYPLNVDTSSVNVRMGDYVDSELEEIYNDEVLNSIVDKWEELAKTRKTIFFTINRKTQAHALADIFRRRGYKAEAIVSDTEDRAELLKKFERNEFQVLVNVNLFTEGLSVDDVDCIGLAFATKSKTKYVQAASRGARPIWNKDYTDWATGPDGEYIKDSCLILDFGGNVRDRHGRLEDYGIDGFDISGVKKRKSMMPAPMKTCPNCFEVVPVSSVTCPSCGSVFPSTKEDGLLATQVEWGVDDPNFAYFRKFKEERMTYKRLITGLKARYQPGLLLPIAVVRGYRESWAVKTAHDLGYGRCGSKDLRSKTDYESIVRYLKRETKKAGYYSTYKNLIEIADGL